MLLSFVVIMTVFTFVIAVTFLVAVMMTTMPMAMRLLHILQFIDLLRSHETPMRICDPCEILRPRLQIQLPQHSVTSVILAFFGYSRRRIRDIAKFNRSRWTC